LGLVLLENGADPNTKGVYGVSAIWFAMRSTPVCQKCFTDALKYHADQNLLDPSGKTRLFKWTEWGIAADASVVQFLVDHGVKDGETVYFRLEHVANNTLSAWHNLLQLVSASQEAWADFTLKPRS